MKVKASVKAGQGGPVFPVKEGGPFRPRGIWRDGMIEIPEYPYKGIGIVI